jgi:hypothetical protein
MTAVHTQPLGAGEIITLLEQAVAERGPDYRYDFRRATRAYYFDDEGTPRCIVGLVATYLGLGKGDLIEGRGAAQQNAINATPWAKHLLEVAQGKQDVGRTWGVAVEDTKHYQRLFGHNDKDKRP